MKTETDLGRKELQLAKDEAYADLLETLKYKRFISIGDIRWAIKSLDPRTCKPCRGDGYYFEYGDKSYMHKVTCRHCNGTKQIIPEWLK